MIAVYPIGFAVTKDFLERTGLKFAEGATDTGVLVSWNTEGVANKDAKNATLAPNGLSINPINWKRDDTYAPAEDNPGTYVTDAEAGTYVEVETKADAQIDLERGVVICTTKELPFITAGNEAMEAFFGPESYHNGDYPFYLDSIRENVKLRCDNYLKAAK